MVVPRRLQEQAIACLNCAASENIRSDSDRLPPGHWPAWEEMLQAFPCPECGETMVWATPARDVEVEVA